MSINLLPNSRRRLLVVESYYSVVAWLTIIILVSFATVFALAFYEQRTIDITINTLTQQRDSSIKEVAAFDSVAQQAANLASSAAEYNQLIAKARAWSSFFAYLHNTIPPDVTLSSITTTNNKESFDVTINGSAGSKASVGLFREALLYYSYDGETGRQRVSQATIDSIQDNDGSQSFTLRLTVDLAPNNGS